MSNFEFEGGHVYLLTSESYRHLEISQASKTSSLSFTTPRRMDSAVLQHFKPRQMLTEELLCQLGFALCQLHEYLVQ